MIIDLRSDTVTKPTPAMRRAMAEAEVGDDVYAEDPTVNRLQKVAAELFGKEEAIFVPTGSMGNQIAIKLHTKPGDEVLCEERGHVFNYEMGSPAVVSGVAVRPVKSLNPNGILSWADIEPALHVDQPYYACPTGLISIENSHNLAGGSVISAKETKAICEKSHKLGIPVHLDGARIFNAAEATGESVAELSASVDSVQFCLSKGLGAPVGSMLLGSTSFIEEARVWRKRMGGGMRQSGILAAAGLIALKDSPPKLIEDHRNAQKLARAVSSIDGVSINLDSVKTNIIIFDIGDTGKTSFGVCEDLKAKDILAIPFGNQIRMVTHFDVTAEQIDTTIRALNKVFED